MASPMYRETDCMPELPESIAELFSEAPSAVLATSKVCNRSRSRKADNTSNIPSVVSQP